MKLNLGCGTNKLKDFINVDSRKEVKPDIVADLNKRLPFESNSVDFILTEHVLEHLSNPLYFIEECWRVLKPGASIKIVSPHVAQFQSDGELDHERIGLSVFSFHYTTIHSVKDRQYYSKARFELTQVKIITHPLIQFLADLSPIKYEHYLSRLFGAREIRFLLTKLK